MNNELTIRITGEAGQGMQTTGEALCRLFKSRGFYIFANQDYMSRIRGGNNFFQVRVSDKPLYTLRRQPGITVALDRAGVDIHKAQLSPGGVMVLDRKKFNFAETDPAFFDVPFYEIAAQTGGSEIFVNSVALGVLARMVDIEYRYVRQTLAVVFAGKEEGIIRKNIEAGQAGYDYCGKNFKKDNFKLKSNVLEGAFKDMALMTGHDAVALGAIYAGVKFYCAYPMTPSTGIMNVIAHFARDFNIVVEQGEDEIGVINMIIGASFAGARSMAATSGGGFALMVEGVSLAGMTETPIVVVDAQRPAPATGFPTRTEQADLDFILHAGHGEFARAVFSPGTIEEAFYLTVKAFNLAEKYQIPVLILTDQHLADSYRNLAPFDYNRVKVLRYVISKEESLRIKNYKRYQWTDSGISPRAIPSWIEEVIYADSDEHTEEGHITEDAATRVRMVEKRFYQKMQGLAREIEKPVASGVEGADLVLIGFGSTYGALKEARESFDGKKVGFVHLPQLWPFPAEDLSALLQGAKKIFTVEQNAGAQLAGLIRRQTGIKVSRSILRFDGRPFDLDYLLEEMGRL